MTDINSKFYNTKVLGHPAGLFIVFFGEMWERFAFYGMRVLIVNFLTMSLIGHNPGWGWPTENATALYGTFAMLIYLTPILGGMVADKITGYKNAVLIGAISLFIGHVCMALCSPVSIIFGLIFLSVGVGFFKPNMLSLVSDIYKVLPDKKDSAFTIFYMGVNSGSFLGMLLCGYLAERVGWVWGFSLAAFIMLLGTIQYLFCMPFFEEIGSKPKKVEEGKTNNTDDDKEKPNPYTLADKILIVIVTIIGIGYAINDPLSKIAGVDLFSLFTIDNFIKGQYLVILIGLVLFIYLSFSRISRYSTIVRDRMIAFVCFAFFVVFFWLCAEQASTSLIIVSRDYIQRELSGINAILFNVFNTSLSLIPLAVLTYVMYLFIKTSFKRIPKAAVFMAMSIITLWVVAIWMFQRDWTSTSYVVKYASVEKPVLDENGVQKTDKNGQKVFTYEPVTEKTVLSGTEKVVEKVINIADVQRHKEGDLVKIITKNKENTSFAILDQKDEDKAIANGIKQNLDNGIVPARIEEIKSNQVEITVSWFSMLNAFFVIALSSLVSKIWESKYNPAGPLKYAIGLACLAIGFGIIGFGTYGHIEGEKINLFWLVAVYLFITLSELCMGPVGLSYVSKLVPARMISLMFGMWYIAVAIGNKGAAMLGGQIEEIANKYSLSTFFMIFTIFPLTASLVIFLMRKWLSKMMHGIK